MTPALEGVDEIDVGEVIDAGSSTSYQRLLVSMTAVAIIFDGADIQFLGIALPALIRDWSMPRAAFAPVLAIGMVGMMLGSGVAGIMGDRYGRKRMLLASVCIFGTATMAMSLAGSLLSLGIMRFVVGFGVGGALPNATALAAEYVPARQRALAVTLTIVSVPIGGALAGLFALAVLPNVGWRGLFLLGGMIPLAAAGLLKAVLIESPRYLAKHPARWPELRAVLRRLGHAVSNTVRFRERVAGPQVRSSITSLLTSGLRKDTIALWTAYVTCMLAVYLGFNWIPSMLTGAGLSPTVGSAGITAFNLGGVVGSLGGAFSFARFGSRVTMVVMALGAATGAFVLSSFHIHAASAFPVVTLLGVTGGLINAVQVTMFALAAQLYPWQIRSTGVGTASAIGRLGAIMSSYVGAWTLEIGGSRLFFLGIAAAMIAAAASLAAISRHIRPHTR